MANRRLYGPRKFVVESIDQHPHVWHLAGRFVEGSVRSKGEREYRIRVKPDERFVGVHALTFRDERVYESESIHYVTRRHTYGSGKWYLAPYHDGSRYDPEVRDAYSFVDFDVIRVAK